MCMPSEKAQICQTSDSCLAHYLWKEGYKIQVEIAVEQSCWKIKEKLQ